MESFILKKFPAVLKDFPLDYPTQEAEKYLCKYDGMVEFETLKKYLLYNSLKEIKYKFDLFYF